MNEENFVIKDNGQEFRFPVGSLMVTHCDLNYLRPGESRIVLHRYIPRELRLQNTLLLRKDRFRSLKVAFRNAADMTRNTVRRVTGNSVILPCHRFNRTSYTAVAQDFLQRCLLLQEEINPKIALIPSAVQVPYVEDIKTVKLW